MRTGWRRVWMGCGIAVWAAGGAWGGEVAVDVPVMSAYVWRGQVLGKDPVAQPGLTGSMGGLSVNAWSSMNLSGTETDGEFTEMDWTVSYARAVGRVKLGAGVVQYTFPNSTVEAEDGAVSAYPGTVEVFASVGVDAPLAPSLAVYGDVDEIEGVYAVASVGHSFEWEGPVGLDLTASLGFGDQEYNEGYFGHEEAALNDLVLGAALPIALAENLRVKPSIGWMLLPDSGLGDAAELAYGEKDRVWGGVTVSCAF